MCIVFILQLGPRGEPYKAEVWLQFLFGLTKSGLSVNFSLENESILSHIQSWNWVFKSRVWFRFVEVIDSIAQWMKALLAFPEICSSWCYQKIKHWRLPINKILCNYFKPGFGLRLSLLSLRGLSHRLWILTNDKKRWLTLIRHMKNKLAGQHWIDSHWAYGVSHISANKNTIFS